MSETLIFNYDIEPRPAPRPRVLKAGWTYMPDWYKKYKKDIVTLTKSQFSGSYLMGDLSMGFVFKRKGKRRADLDNLIKGVKDSLQNIVYANDQQIIKYHEPTEIIYESENPGITVTIKRA